MELPKLVHGYRFAVHGKTKTANCELLARQSASDGGSTVNRRLRRGFTLIELMVVITIIAIIMSIAYISFATAQNKGRDAKRKQDLKAIRSALTSYYRDKGFYPPNPAGASQYASDNVSEWITGLVTPVNYMKSIPTDPGQGNLSGTATCSGKTHIYCYTVTANGADYALWAQLDNTADSEAIGKTNSICPITQSQGSWGAPLTFNYCVESQK